MPDSPYVPVSAVPQPAHEPLQLLEHSQRCISWIYEAAFSDAFGDAEFG